jgi:hypothetical protein
MDVPQGCLLSASSFTKREVRYENGNLRTTESRDRQDRSEEGRSKQMRMRMLVLIGVEPDACPAPIPKYSYPSKE